MPARNAPALERGLDILEMVQEKGDGVSFSAIVKALDLPSSTAARLLKALVDRGYLTKDGARREYRVGPKGEALSPHLAQMQVLLSVCEGVLGRLRAETECSALLHLWHGAQMQVLAKQVHENALGMQAVGTVSDNFLERPWGWVFYAAMEPAGQEEVLRRAGAGAAVRARLAEVCRNLAHVGYAYLDDGRGRRFAAPVRNGGGRVVAAVVLGGTPATVADEDIEDYGRRVVAHAETLSRALGWQQERLTEEDTG